MGNGKRFVNVARPSKASSSKPLRRLLVSGEIGRKDSLHLLKEPRDLPLDDIPNDLLVDGRIGMNGDVAEAGDAAPFDFWITVPDLSRNVPCGLAGDLQVPHDRVEGLLISDKLFQRHGFGVAQDLPAAVAHVLQVETRVTRHGLP